MARDSLPFAVYCKSTYPFFERIAAFNVDSAAGHYALECARCHPEFSYEVRKGRKVMLAVPAREG